MGGPTCSVLDLTGLTLDEAEALLEESGCALGQVIEDDGGPDPGTITKQSVDPGTNAPPGTEIDVTVSGPLCNIGDLSGLDEDAARAQVEAEGCRLEVSTGPTDDPTKVGKVVDQNPDPGSQIPGGSVVDVIVGGSEVRGVQLQADPADIGGDGNPSTLPRTGGIALAGLAVALTGSGLILRLAGWGSGRSRRRPPS
ncbi:MAG: PASTA domain-containing protein [Acidimicrobiia bacterium]